MSHVSPQVPGKLDSSHPIIYLHQVWIRSKLPHNTHIQYYLRHCTLISILSALENIIWLTPPCDIIHQSWCSHTRPLSPLRNDPSQLSFYHDDRYTSFIVHNSHQTRTHPSPSRMSWVDYLFFTFWINLLIEHAKKIPRLLIYDLYPSEYIYGYKTLQSMSPILWRPRHYYTNPTFPTKKYRVFFVTYCPTHFPTIQNTTPSTHYTKHN